MLLHVGAAIIIATRHRHSIAAKPL
jgi:hypothetical protein